jgi:O-antigen biosynthesis protein
MVADNELPSASGRGLSITGACVAEYWSEKWTERTELLNAVVTYLTDRRWAKVVDPGWSDCDLAIYCHPCTEVRVCTVQEDHGGGRRLLRVRYRMLPRAPLWLAGLCGAVAALSLGVWLGWIAGAATAAGLAAVLLGIWFHAAFRSGRAVAVFNHAAAKLEMTHCNR